MSTAWIPWVSSSRTQPLLRLQPGQLERRTHDYKRHGTNSLRKQPWPLNFTHPVLPLRRNAERSGLQAGGGVTQPISPLPRDFLQAIESPGEMTEFRGRRTAQLRGAREWKVRQCNL